MTPADPDTHAASRAMPAWALTGLGVLLMAFPVAGILAKHSMTLLAIALAVCFGVRCLRLGRWPRLSAGLLVVAVLFLVWTAAGVLTVAAGCARCGESWLQLLGAMVLFLPLGAGALSRPSSGDAEVLLRWLLAGAVLATIVLVVELTFDASLYRFFSGRDDDPAVDPSRFNRGAVALVLLSVPLIGWIWSRGSRAWAVALGLGVGSAASLGDSQAAALMALVAVVVALVARRRPRLVATALLLGALLGGLAAPWIGGQFQAWRLASGADVPLSTVHRFEIWDHAAHYARAAPLTGWGVGAYRTLPLEGPMSESYVVSDHVEAHPHNAFLQLWVETGVVGLVLWLAGLALVLKAGLSSPPGPRAAALTTVAVGLVPGMVSFGLWQATYLAMLAVAGLAVHLVGVAGERRRSAGQPSRSDTSRQSAP